MKIGIDLSQIVYSGTGVARYTRGLLQSILQYNRQHQWSFFFSSLRQKFPADLENEIIRKGYSLNKYPFPLSALSFLWNQLHWGDMRLLMGKLDWFISSDWIEPPFNHTKKATIIHDLVFLRFPETVNWKILKTQQQRLIHVCQESDLILADSYATYQDIEKLLAVKKAKVKVLYPGLNVIMPSKQIVKRTLERLNLTPKNFILTVGKLEPRKNLERLIEAYSRLQTNSPLVIVGPKGWGSLNLAGENVKLVGYLSDLELNSLYQSCQLFIYPSLYEGFGYPLLEAASFQAPLAVSNRSSLKELGEGIAIMFDPENVSDMALQIKSLLTNSKLSKELGQKAKLRAKEFTWGRTFHNLINYLEQG